MMVLVHVEGPSDRAGMEKLFRGVIETGKQRGVGIRFIAAGDKARVLKDVPNKAALHLRNKPSDWVVAVPDLHPTKADGDTAHSSASELRSLLNQCFERAADRHGLSAPARSHFRAFCFQYDVEALVLAAPTVLRERLRTRDAIDSHWRRPVETQNGDQPPKRVVEALFTRYGTRTRYRDTVDLPWLLERVDLPALEQACPRQFAPFSVFLRERIGRSG
jgi:Domain of unknown function (DUF4276)